MIMPAYICEIFYPILKEFNIQPIFLDIDLKTFNIKPEEIAQKITPQVKAILLCHTYGLPLDIEKIKQSLSPLTSNPPPLLIEDIAHSLGARHNSQFMGNFGEAAFVSLYKQFPALRGGLAILPNTNVWMSNTQTLKLLNTRFSLRDFVSLLNYFWVFSFLFKNFGNKIAPKYVRQEKYQREQTLGGLNRVSLNLFHFYLKDALKNGQKELSQRKQTAAFLKGELEKLGFQTQSNGNNIYTFLSALVPENLFEKRGELVKKLRKKGVFLTRIWHTPIILNKEAQKEYRINLANFPNTVEAAKRIVNIPLQNHYTLKDAQKIIKKLKTALQEIRA